MKAVSYFSFVWFTSAAAVPIGGTIYLVFSLFFRIPILGRALSFLFHDLVNVTVILKLASWFAGASGAALGYLWCRRIIGAPDADSQWYAILIAASIPFLEVGSQVITFRFFDVANITKITAKFAPPDVEKTLKNAAASDVSMLLFQNFADLTFGPLLRLLVSFGVMVFALANLGLLHTSSGALPSLRDCLVTSFSLMSLASVDTIAFTGPVWPVLRLSVGVILLVWAVAFITIGVDVLPKGKESRVALGLPPDVAEISSERDAVTAQSAGVASENKGSPPTRDLTDQSPSDPSPPNSAI